MRRALLLVAIVLAVGVGCGGDNSDSGEASGDVSFMVFGDPDEIQGLQEHDRRVRERESGRERGHDRGRRSGRPDRAAFDLVRGRHAAGPVPAQLPLPRPVRVEGRARADRGPRRRLGRLPAGRLLRGGDGCVPVRRQAHVLAAEHLEPGRLLQQGHVREGRCGRAEGRLEVGRHGCGCEEAAGGRPQDRRSRRRAGDHPTRAVHLVGRRGVGRRRREPEPLRIRHARGAECDGGLLRAEPRRRGHPRARRRSSPRTSRPASSTAAWAC